MNGIHTIFLTGWTVYYQSVRLHRKLNRRCGVCEFLGSEWTINHSKALAWHTKLDAVPHAISCVFVNFISSRKIKWCICMANRNTHSWHRPAATKYIHYALHTSDWSMWAIELGVVTKWYLHSAFRLLILHTLTLWWHTNEHITIPSIVECRQRDTQCVRILSPSSSSSSSLLLRHRLVGR